MTPKLRSGKSLLPPIVNSESEPAEELSDGEVPVSNRVVKQIKYCMDMKPQTFNSVESIKNKLNSIRQGKKDKNIRPVDTERKKIESVVADFASDMARMNSNFQILLDCLTDIIPRLEQIDYLEGRVSDLECKLEAVTQFPFLDGQTAVAASVVGMPSARDGYSDRLDRLEYLSSEEEREKRILQAVVTHPDLNADSSDMREHMLNFLRTALDMPEREIDSNMTIQKTGRPNTITINFTRKLFKKFLYAARAKLRRSNPERCGDLFINDNLTHYNFSLLRALKRERRRRGESQLNNFVSVFSLDGRVYVKTSSECEKLHIKSKDAYTKYLEALGSNCRGSSTRGENVTGSKGT